LFEWLVETFDPGKFPGLKDELTHPSEFEAVYKSESLTYLFGGFSTEGW
jgi:hypothetical protein